MEQESCKHKETFPDVFDKETKICQHCGKNLKADTVSDEYKQRQWIIKRQRQIKNNIGELEDEFLRLRETLKKIDRTVSRSE